MADVKPGFHGLARIAGASTLVEATGEALWAIKKEGNLHWSDIGVVLGRGEDQAAQYGKGNAEMGFTAWLRAARQWNGRFSVAAPLVGLSINVTEHIIHRTDIKRGVLSLTLVMADLQKALLDEACLNDHELEAMAAPLDQAGQFLSALQLRLAQIRAQRAQEGEP